MYNSCFTWTGWCINLFYLDWFVYKSVLPGLVGVYICFTAIGLCVNLLYLDWFVYKSVLPGLVGV